MRWEILIPEISMTKLKTGLLLIPLLALVLTLFGIGTGAKNKPLPKLWFQYQDGGIIRKITPKREISLVFSADHRGEGSGIILDALKKYGIKAGFFLTGNYLKNPANLKYIKRIIGEKHFIGPHSYHHLYYNHWGSKKVLITKKKFNIDIQKNIRTIAVFGVDPSSITLLLPPYETFNATITKWANDEGLKIFTFTPKTLTYRDWTPKNHRSYISSNKIIKIIKGNLKLNKNYYKGAIFLIHLGVDKYRPDPLYHRLDDIINEFYKNGYKFARIDKFLLKKDFY